MNNDNLMPIPQNFKNNVEWILGAYTDAGVSFTNGFQKDAIQNAVGARKHNKWKDWACDISYIENSKGRFVIVEDFGTMGLTGENKHCDEINAMMARGEILPPEERLARFTSMFNSGGNTTGGGLFGAGKSVYSVASEEYTYYFDSFREDGKYVANVNKQGQVMPLAYEDDAAKKFILDETGLTEKTSKGTRVIIKSPKTELSDSINNGEIISYIQESWWRIIERLGSDSYISVNGVSVTVPDDIKNATHKCEIDKIEAYANYYKIKHFGFYVFQDGGNRWNSLSYYRKGMKIGEIELKDIPDKLKDKFWGYIEVDDEWETELADIEDKVHFGVSRGKKKCSAYQNLKNHCNTKVRSCLIDWGFIRDKEHEDKKLHDQLEQIAEELQSLFDKLGFEDLGKGPQKPDFDVRWKNIKYPIPETERVTTGDSIDFTMRIKSAYTTEKKMEYRIYVENPINNEIVYQICKAKLSVKPNEVVTQDFNFIVTQDNSIQFAENRIILVVKVIGSGKEKRKELPFFYDAEKDKSIRENVTLHLHECMFPQPESRRVNFDEAIKNVSYRIENKRNHELKYKLNISIHNANDINLPKIADIVSLKGSVKPFEDDVTPSIEEIVFSEAHYSKFLDKGVLELRARLIADEDDDEYEKGDKITSYKYKIFLNCDEKNGMNDAFDVKSQEVPENYRRSWCEPGTNRSIVINVGHVSYLSLQDYPDIQREYLREQMLKQYVWLYLLEGRYDMFGQEFSELEPHEAAPIVLEKIESVYFESLK